MALAAKSRADFYLLDHKASDELTLMRWHDTAVDCYHGQEGTCLIVQTIYIQRILMTFAQEDAGWRLGL